MSCAEPAARPLSLTGSCHRLARRSAAGAAASALAFPSGLQWPARGRSPRSRPQSRLLPSVAPFAARKAAALTASIARRCGSSQATYGLQKGSTMSHHTYGAPHAAPFARIAAGGRARARVPAFASLSALDVGLRVRIEARPLQQTIFSGAENLSAQELTSELAVTVSRLRVRSVAMRGQLEHVTSALMVNVRCGFWLLARRAALALAGLLAQARKRALADAELSVRAAHGALRVAELCAKAVCQ